MNKPGMAKYASRRGPHPQAPAREGIDFWSRDVSRCREWLDQAITDGEAGRIRLAASRLLSAQGELDVWMFREAKESLAAVAGIAAESGGCI